MRGMGTIPQRASLAAQVAAQARPVSVTPIRQAILPPSNAPITVSDLDSRFRSVVNTERRSAAESAYLAYRLWSANNWESLGYKDEESYCDSVGIGYRWWQRRVTIGERLQHLTLAEIQGFSFAALENLGRVHPSLWSEFAWVEEAKLLPPREFSMLVTQRNAAVVKDQLYEPRRAMTIRVPVSQQPVMERRLETIRRQMRLSSVADALNFALESVDRVDLMSDLLEEVQTQVTALKQLYDVNRLAESSAEKESRLADGSDKSLTMTAFKAAQLLKRIDRALGEAADALPKETVHEAGTGAGGTAV
jgi:hypothetical protein